MRRPLPPQRDWDVIVVGAGPAGALSAILAARRGLRTLLVERKPLVSAKACGGCFNLRALAALRHSGLARILNPPHAIPLTRCHLRAWSKQADLELPYMVAASRAYFDAALRQEAEASGAVVMWHTRARCCAPLASPPQHPADPELQCVETCSVDDGSHANATRHAAKVVIVADGLGRPSLRALSSVFPEHLHDAARIGLAGETTGESAAYAPGELWMGVASHGYVGVVRLPDGKLNIAAAVAPHVLAQHASRAEAIGMMAAQAGLPELPLESSMAWRGTPQLNRFTSPVAARRLFLVGDATGYVEPFTGEGIGNALHGAVLLDSCIPLAVEGRLELARRRWQRLFQQHIWTRRRWCRFVATLARHPALAAASVRCLRAFPFLARPILRRVTTSVHDPYP